MRRRDFIALVGSAVIAWPLATRAQQGGKPATIGLLGSGTAAAQNQWTAAFLGRMRELGWAEGRNLAIEYRWAEGHTERLPELSSELVRLKVDVIVTHNTPPPLAAKRATSTIPIVFATSGDPVGTGIVASLARPGGNVTGLSSQQPETAAKRVQLLRELIPGLRRLAILADVDNPFTTLDVAEVHHFSRHRKGLFADLDPPQTFVLRADEILGNERQTVWRSGSAASVASACNSISRADHAAGLRDPTPYLASALVSRVEWDPP
jgi:putative tryptophan/tyrosine transport system substrate-binding protein